MEFFEKWFLLLLHQNWLQRRASRALCAHNPPFHNNRRSVNRFLTNGGLFYRFLLNGAIPFKAKAWFTHTRPKPTTPALTQQYNVATLKNIAPNLTLDNHNPIQAPAKQSDSHPCQFSDNQQLSNEYDSNTLRPWFLVNNVMNPPLCNL
jgi:hypothetical protein